MRIVYKFPINGPGDGTPPCVAEVQMPADSVVLTVEIQKGFITLWVLAETEVKATQARHFLIMPTGQPFPKEYQYSEYIGTVQEGPPSGYVWHIFDATYAYEKAPQP